MKIKEIKMISIVHNMNEVYKKGKIQIENAYVMDEAIPDVLAKNPIMNFPLTHPEDHLQDNLKSSRFEVINDATLTKIKAISNYGIFDIGLKDEFGYDKLRSWLTPYKHFLVGAKRNLLGFVESVRLVLFVQRFKFSDYKILGYLIKDIFADLEIDAVILNKWNYTNNILKKTPNSNAIFNDGISLTHKMLKAYRRPKNHRRFNDDLYPVVLSIFKELGFLPVSIFGPMIEKAHFYHDGTQLRGYMWYPNSPFNLWHDDPNKKINIYDLFVTRFKFSDYVINQTLEEKISMVGTQLEVIEAKVDLSRLTTANKRFFSSFGAKEDNSILCIKSAMGSAKTDVIRKLMESNKTLVVTPRTQLAIDLAKRTGAQCYLDDAVDSSNHLVVQFDSLFKFDVSKYSHFIIDEYMTLESHIVQCSTSTLVKNMQKMQYILNSNVILIDAMLTKNALDIFSNQRRTAYWYENSMMDPVPLISHKTFASFLKEISSAQGKRITISCTSKNKLLGLQEFVQSIGYKNKIIIGETPMEERTNILESFKREEFNCLLYSPAISVGISIESPVEKHFHYDPGGIISPIQSIQMIRRSRKTKQIEVFLQKRKKYGTCSIEEIRNDIKNSGQLCEYDNKGAQRLSQAGKSFAWMKRHDHIWRLEGRDSFNFLASLNFNVMNDVEVQGAELFTGSVLRKFTMDSKKWSPELREITLSYFGDNVIIENNIEPEELNDFKLFMDLKRCYFNPVNIEFTKLSYYNKGIFTFEKYLKEFTLALESIDRFGYYKSKQDLTYLGLQPARFSIGKKWVLNPKFENLFQEINKNKGV